MNNSETVEKPKRSKATKAKKLIEFYNDESGLYEIGIDEVGRGPMFGRVYCAAVILPKSTEFKFELMKDSKKFTSQKKIIEASEHIKTHATAWAIEYVDEQTIDSINIRNATHGAMHKAIRSILEKQQQKHLTKDNYNEQYYLLVDGNDFKPFIYLNEKSDILEQINHVSIEGGDNKYCAIAAASILAKVERDAYIREMCDKYKKLHEYYSLESNKGYGTKAHLEGIEKYGISPWHRKSYGSCKSAQINPEEFYV